MKTVLAMLVFSVAIGLTVWVQLSCVEPTPEPDFELDAFIEMPYADMCYEYWMKWYPQDPRPCPEGYGPVTVNTPTSDNKPDCRESFGAVIDCGRIVEP